MFIIKFCSFSNVQEYGRWYKIALGATGCSRHVPWPYQLYRKNSNSRKYFHYNFNRLTKRQWFGCKPITLIRNERWKKCSVIYFNFYLFTKKQQKVWKLLKKANWSNKLEKNTYVSSWHHRPSSGASLDGPSRISM